MEILEQLSETIVGLPVWAGVLAIVVATFVSEDLTCIGAGLIAARGDMEPVLAIGAAGLGIFLGDLLLYLAGRKVGRPALRLAPIRWFVHDEDVARSQEWFEHRGPIVILLGRAVPGSRLPTYFTAGLLGVGVFRFAFFCLIAVALWAPLLGGASFYLGRQVLAWIELYERWALPILIGTAVFIVIAVKFIIPLFNWRGRRMVVSRLCRLRRWEFWPPWVFYPPLVLYFLWLALRYRSLSLLTAVNPGIYAGGFVGESKSMIMAGWKEPLPELAKTAKIEGGQTLEARVADGVRFMEEHGLDFPIVLKPDVGQRGSGVRVVRDKDEMSTWFESVREDSVVQEYVPGDELGIFYYRRPSEERGRVFSITRKEFPVLVGDGRSSLERLILTSPETVCAAKSYLEANVHHLWDVPAEGKRVQLVEIGNHCLGARFLDGSDLWTEEMEQAIDRISKGFEGFYFGRYDVRAASLDDIRGGRDFKVIELNGATSEATHIYDPSFSLWRAYGVLFEQWRVLFEIAAENRDRGARIVPWTDLLEDLGQYRRLARRRP